MAGGRVEVINSKGCSKLLIGFSSSFPSVGSFRSAEPMAQASSVTSEAVARVGEPFSGLIICVTGLSKEARKQVMAATERLGGQYSGDLHPQCTHLVVQSFGGRKFEHALKHGPKNGLFVVTFGWFVDSVRRNARLSESLYSVKNIGENGSPTGNLNRLVGFPGSGNSCLPTILREDNKASNSTWQPHLQFSGKDSRSKGSILASDCIYIDSNVSSELQKKVVDAASREGATFVDHWFVGCNASHVVCEGSSIHKYIGHTNNLVTPMWILKTTKEKNVQRLMHLSADLARQVAMILENVQKGLSDQDTNIQGVPPDLPDCRVPLAFRKTKESLEERQQIINLAKTSIRNRRGRRMQSCHMPIRPITPSALLDSICWSISEPASTACIYTDSSEMEDANERVPSEYFDADGRESEASFDNFSRPLRERFCIPLQSSRVDCSEKREVIFKNSFLTILFPIDRFGEMGPSSRTFFSNGSFTCLQLLDHIYAFYQEIMSPDETEVAIHTDSKHADRLRSVYASKESVELGFVPFKRIDFLGSRRSFEMLKRVSGDSTSNVYELLIRA